MNDVQRIALAVRYDGSAYHGWQAQDGLATIQQAVEKAASVVANHPVSVVCAGRTDAGVHATGQVVHFDTHSDRDLRAWVFGVNSHLPPDIRVLWASIVPMTFHARFSAVQRTYRYVLYNYDTRPGILRHFVGWYYRPLDAGRMQQAANYLLGEHDFSALRAAGCQAKHPIRHIRSIEVRRQRQLIVIEVTANAFLLHMVRNMVGTLVRVGTGEAPPEWVADVLASRDRSQAGVTIAPNGLYLVHVQYQAGFSLPQTPVGPFFLPV